MVKYDKVGPNTSDNVLCPGRKSASVPVLAVWVLRTYGYMGFHFERGGRGSDARIHQDLGKGCQSSRIMRRLMSVIVYSKFKWAIEGECSSGKTSGLMEIRWLI
jgi:hypothetical protein